MNHFSGRRLALQWAFCLPASSLLLNHAYANDGVLRVSAIPDEAPTELQRKFTPLGNYLSAQTGLKVVFTPVTDYAAVVEALAAVVRSGGSVLPVADANGLVVGVITERALVRAIERPRAGGADREPV